MTCLDLIGSFAAPLRRWGGIGGAIALLGSAGCASSDVSKNPETTSEVVECLPTDAPPPSMVVRAVWYPNASGFGSTDASPRGRATGVLALAGDTLYFLSWNQPEHHYDVLHSVATLPAAKISVVHGGPLTMLVIQSRNMSFDSFELMRGGQFSSDSPATQDLYDRIQLLRAKNPPAGP